MGLPGEPHHIDMSDSLFFGNLTPSSDDTEQRKKSDKDICYQVLESIKKNSRFHLILLLGMIFRYFVCNLKRLGRVLAVNEDSAII